MEKTPKELGYRMPSEWEPHKAIWLAWPHDTISFGSLNEKEGNTDKDRLRRVREKIIEIILAVKESEPVNLLVLSDDMKKEIGIEGINYILADYADVWVRDYGPIFMKKKNDVAMVKWNYDAYGNKFPQLLKDNKVFLKFEDKFIFKPGIVLEGGSVEQNGKGIGIATEECLIEKSRNAMLGKAEMEKYLKDYYNLDKIIWIKKGLHNDHTDGHIDNVAKFVSTDTVLCGHEPDQNNPNFKILNEACDILEKNNLQVIKIPMPHMKYNNGEPAPVSYINSYIGNKIVLVPSFADQNDNKAIEIYQNIFPAKKIISIDMRDVVYGGGGLHCLTREEPAN